jgi:hypothetical protein
MSIEKLGVRVANPETTITLEGTSYAELVLFEHLRAENLLRCILALNVAAPHGEDELLVEVQTQLQGMANASAGVLQDLLRVAREQGLRFEIAPKAGDLH